MDKRCRVCTAKFGLFKKEVECNRCRVALCKDCRSYTVTENQESLTVCKNCYTAATAGNNSRSRSPPLNFKRELEAKKLAANVSAPQHHHIGEMDEEDLKLAARLNKLINETPKTKDTSIAALELRLSKLKADEQAPTQEEIEYRLAKLKGDRPPVVKVHSIRKKSGSHQAASSSNNETPDRQVKKLIRQYTEEAAMDMEYDPSMQTDFDPDRIPEEATAADMIRLAQEEIKRDKEQEERYAGLDREMQERFRKLHGSSSDHPHISKQTRTTSFDLSDEEEEKLIKRLTDEAALEVSLPRPRGSSLGGVNTMCSASGGVQANRSGKKLEENDDLPWCVICNEDATLRCQGCEGDLYCRRCFKECHDKYDLADHKTTKYNPPKDMDCD